MKSKDTQWLLSGLLIAWCAGMHATGATVRISGGVWRTFSHVSGTGLLVEASSDLGGTGTVHGAATVRGSLSPGTGTNTGTLAFTDGVMFEEGRLNIHAADSAVLSRIEAGGAVSGTATVRMTRALTAFPTQQVVVAGSGTSDYGAFSVQPSTNWTKGSSGALHLWVTYQDSTAVTLYDFYMQEVNGGISVCWQTAAEEKSVGFDLFRRDGQAWAKVNDALIRSQGEMGGSYCVTDAGADAESTFRYKLVEYETDGGVQEYGPYTVAARNPRMEHMCLTPEGVVLRWLSREQDTYEVQRTGDLMSPPETIATGLPATPPVNVYTDQVERAGTAFYRIRVDQARHGKAPLGHDAGSD